MFIRGLQFGSGGGAVFEEDEAEVSLRTGTSAVGFGRVAVLLPGHTRISRNGNGYRGQATNGKERPQTASICEAAAPGDLRAIGLSGLFP